MPKGLICPSEPQNGRVPTDVTCANTEDYGRRRWVQLEGFIERDSVAVLPVDKCVLEQVTS